MTYPLGGKKKKRKYLSLARRDGERCRECGTTEVLTIDHVIPRSEGGSNSLENLQLLCEPCNNAKGNAVPSGYRFNPYI